MNSLNCKNLNQATPAYQSSDDEIYTIMLQVLSKQGLTYKVLTI